MALPPPQAGRQPLSPRLEQRYGFVAALSPAGTSTLLAAVAAATPLAPV